MARRFIGYLSIKFQHKNYLKWFVWIFTSSEHRKKFYSFDNNFWCLWKVTFTYVNIFIEIKSRMFSTILFLLKSILVQLKCNVPQIALVNQISYFSIICNENALAVKQNTTAHRDKWVILTFIIICCIDNGKLEFYNCDWKNVNYKFWLIFMRWNAFHWEFLQQNRTFSQWKNSTIAYVSY